ncbi:hypothetical protein OUZ56_029574 [Daphnia magna]|uniref:MULE transposase domain-containing protein n=1 Tax=Daphnia magna TaxID=35525 RepID=A0ABR0B773_9CRUS|nr:hypothetical protein OUZ56_029574 [Daphnia magna]
MTCGSRIAITVALFLMTNKTQALYECCLCRLLEVCQQDTGRVPEPTLLISDYELAILQSLSAVFPTGRARGCYHHSWMICLLPRDSTSIQDERVDQMPGKNGDCTCPSPL